MKINTLIKIALSPEFLHHTGVIANRKAHQIYRPLKEFFDPNAPSTKLFKKRIAQRNLFLNAAKEKGYVPIAHVKK